MRLQVFSIILTLLLILQQPLASTSQKCMRQPMNTKSTPGRGDNGYRIKVTDPNSGNSKSVDRIEPGKIYNINIDSRDPNSKFTDFFLTVVPMNTPVKNESKNFIGKFLHTAMTMPSRNCKTIAQRSSSSRPVEKEFLKWQAPLMLKSCVELRATVQISVDTYFMDEGELTASLCPMLSAHQSEQLAQVLNDMPVDDDMMGMPPTIKDCCACGVATYSLEFQGKWTRQLHSRFWPTNENFVHWSDIVGASHNRDYFIYYLGGMASSGVQSVCEFGDSAPLEREFRDKAESNVWTIIKAKGIWGGNKMAESRSAIFAVNRTHHLVSMLSMIGPSPDWCSGFSAEDMCQSDCTWKENLTLDLYPWDAGVKTGNTYEPEVSIREINQKTIKPISKNWPANNPFSVENDKIRPVATVIIKRLSPKKNWQCDNKPMEPVVENAPEDTRNSYKVRPGKMYNQKPEDKLGSLKAMVPSMCKFTPWSSWSQCSVTCGVGEKIRTRKIQENLKPALCSLVPLLETDECQGITRTCQNTMCSLTNWSPWSPCNATCYQPNGIRSMHRKYMNRTEEPQCMRKDRYVKLVNYSACTVDPIVCDPTVICSEPRKEGSELCRKNITKFYYDLGEKKCLSFQYKGCKGSKNSFNDIEGCEKMCLKAFSKEPGWKVDKLRMKQQEDHMKLEKQMAATNRYKCLQAMSLGFRCTDDTRITSRWYYDKMRKRCLPLVFLGCGGTTNRFDTEKECALTCHEEKMLSAKGPKQDCLLSEWGQFSPCSKLCGGTKTRSRQVLRDAMNGGKECGPRDEMVACSSAGCKTCSYSAWSDWGQCAPSCGRGRKERTRTRLVDANSATCVAEGVDTLNIESCYTMCVKKV